jgi:hypothetical protein
MRLKFNLEVKCPTASFIVLLVVLGHLMSQHGVSAQDDHSSLSHMRFRMGWRVGPVQRVMDDHKHFAGSGFVLLDDNGRPCVTFGFTSEQDASTGAKKMSELIALSKEIMRPPG